MAFFHARTALYALLALVTMTVFTGQHMVPPMDRDESRFAQASRQMLQSGDYVTIRFQDELRAKKPAGIYWLQSASAALLGDAEIASYRFVNLLALLVSIFMLYHIGLRLYEPSPTPPIKAGSSIRPIMATSTAPTNGTVILEMMMGHASRQICRQLV